MDADQLLAKLANSLVAVCHARKTPVDTVMDFLKKASEGKLTTTKDTASASTHIQKSIGETFLRHYAKQEDLRSSIVKSKGRVFAKIVALRETWGPQLAKLAEAIAAVEPRGELRLEELVGPDKEGSKGSEGSEGEDEEGNEEVVEADKPPAKKQSDTPKEHAKRPREAPVEDPATTARRLEEATKAYDVAVAARVHSEAYLRQAQDENRTTVPLLRKVLDACRKAEASAAAVVAALADEVEQTAGSGPDAKKPRPPELPALLANLPKTARVQLLAFGVTSVDRLREVMKASVTADSTPGQWLQTWLGIGADEAARILKDLEKPVADEKGTPNSNSNILEGHYVAGVPVLARTDGDSWWEENVPAKWFIYMGVLRYRPQAKYLSEWEQSYNIAHAVVKGCGGLKASDKELSFTHEQTKEKGLYMLYKAYSQLEVLCLRDWSDRIRAGAKDESGYARAMEMNVDFPIPEDRIKEITAKAKAVEKLLRVWEADKKNDDKTKVEVTVKGAGQGKRDGAKDKSSKRGYKGSDPYCETCTMHHPVGDAKACADFKAKKPHKKG